MAIPDRASLAFGVAVAVDGAGAGALYVADTGNQRVVKVADGGLTTIAGFGALNRPESVAADAAGTVYIADTFNGRIKRVSADGSLVTVAAKEGAIFSSSFSEH